MIVQEIAPLAGMRRPDPLATLDRRSDPSLLMERDPMLWHALRLHGRTWNPADAGRLDLPGDPESRRPTYRLRADRRP